MHRGKIAEVDAQIPPENAVVINCGGMLLMPGKSAACWDAMTDISTLFLAVLHSALLQLCWGSPRGAGPQPVQIVTWQQSHSSIVQNKPSMDCLPCDVVSNARKLCDPQGSAMRMCM